MTADLTAEQRNGLSEVFCEEYPEASDMLTNLKNMRSVCVHADKICKGKTKTSDNWRRMFLPTGLQDSADDNSAGRSNRCASLISKIYGLEKEYTTGCDGGRAW